MATEQRTRKKIKKKLEIDDIHENNEENTIVISHDDITEYNRERFEDDDTVCIDLIESNFIHNDSFQMQLSMDDINVRIQREINYDILEELKDENLISEYKECVSVINEINNLEKILIKYVDEEIKQNIIDQYLLHLIPPGTKGVIRGNKFNQIVKKYILELELDPERFDICFEKNCDSHSTSEKPDWYILEKFTNKILIGMNQLDLWRGGQQLNRGSKYIINNIHNNQHSKLLCVVCNEIQFKNNKNKVYKLFEIGFQNNTLCYLNNLKNIIISFFF